MDLEQKKVFNRLLGCFGLFLVFRLIEELLIIPKYVNSKGIVCCLGGLVVLLFYIRFVNKPLEDIGMIFSGHKVRKAVILTAVLNVIPAVLVFACEYFYYSRKDGFAHFSIFYDDPLRSYSESGLQGLLIGFGISLGLAILHSFFYEMAFRGLLISLGSRSMPFSVVNAIQAALYTFWYLIPVARLLLFNPGVYSTDRIIALVVFSILYESVAAVKLGLLRKATGSVWICIFDHLAFSVILDMVHMQFSLPTGEVATDFSLYYRMFAYQAVALVITVIYYKKKTRKVYDIQQSIQLQSQNG